MANCLLFIAISAQLFAVIVADLVVQPTDPLLDTSHQDISLKADQTSGEGDRTLITISIVRWLLNIFKAMIKPLRDVYLAVGPEISVMKCLSDSSSTRQPVWKGLENDPESPRRENDELFSENSSADPLSADSRLLRRIPRFVDEVANVFKNADSMGCIVPYMNERIFRWLDS